MVHNLRSNRLKKAKFLLFSCYLLLVDVRLWMSHLLQASRLFLKVKTVSASTICDDTEFQCDTTLDDSVWFCATKKYFCVQLQRLINFVIIVFWWAWKTGKMWERPVVSALSLQQCGGCKVVPVWSINSCLLSHHGNLLLFLSDVLLLLLFVVFKTGYCQRQ